MKIEWHVGDVIERLRKNAGFTQEQLAKLAKLKRPASIGAIESTGNCRGTTLKNIASALNVRDADLLALVPYEPTQPAPLQIAHAFVCDDISHTKLHKLLENILEDESEGADDWRENVVANLRSVLIAALIGDTPPKGTHKRKRWSGPDIGVDSPDEKVNKVGGKK